jgi:hypothetical protein
LRYFAVEPDVRLEWRISQGADMGRPSFVADPLQSRMALS